MTDLENKVDSQQKQQENNFETLSKEIQELSNRDENNNLILSDDKIDGLITENFSEKINSDQAKNLLNQLYDEDHIDKKNELINSINTHINSICNLIRQIQKYITTMNDHDFNTIKQIYIDSGLTQILDNTISKEELKTLTTEQYTNQLNQTIHFLNKAKGQLQIAPERFLAHTNHLLSACPTKIENFNTTNLEPLYKTLKDFFKFAKDISQIQSNLENIAYPDLESKEAKTLMNQLNNIKNKKNDISYLLSSEFIGKISKDDAKQIIQKIDKADGENNEQLQYLQNVLNPIANPLNVNRTLDGITNDGEGKFYSGVEKTSEGEETKSEVQKTKDKINTILSDIPQIDDGKQFYEEINSIKTNLQSIQTILESPTTNNTKILQKFIYDNLPEEKKSDFETNNHYKVRNGEPENSFDGQFGQSTLNSLNDVLDTLKTHIENINNSLGIQKNADDTITKQEEQQQSPVSDSSTENEPETSVDATPLTIGDKEYAPMKNSSQLAKKVGLEGFTLYSKNPIESTSTDETENIETADGNKNSEPSTQHNYTTDTMPFDENASANGDKLYRAQRKDGTIYEIRLDSNGQLYPIAKKHEQQLKGFSSEMLIQNNDSCKAYLQSHLQGTKATIGRNDKYSDYTISSYGKTLTIEPMTIAGDWVSNDLSTCLKLLNLTNYLRSENEPDFKYKVLSDNMGNQFLRKRGSKEIISLTDFGLQNVDQGVLQKFIKYNNHEDRNDNRDKKKENRWIGKGQIE